MIPMFGKPMMLCLPLLYGFITWNLRLIAAIPDGCEKGYFRCAEEDKCVSQQHWCDGSADCKNGDDEQKNCQPKFTTFENFKTEVGPMVCFNKIREQKDLPPMDSMTGIVLKGLDEQCGVVDNEHCECFSEDGGSTFVLSCHADETPLRIPRIPPHTRRRISKLMLKYDYPWTLVPSAQTGKAYFSSMTTLLHYDLSDSHLTNISSGSFNGLNLTNLVLSHNGLSALESGTFDGSVICDIDLSHNFLADFPADAFGDDNMVSWLDLGSNNITVVNTSVFQKLTKLSILDLSNNEIRHIGNHSLAPLVTLRQLDLSYNPIQAIEALAFEELISLSVLRMRYTQLESLPARLLMTMINLRELDLEGSSRITSFPLDFFHDFNCNYLNLRGIIIQNIQEEMFKHLPPTCNVVFEKLMYCFYAPQIRNCTPKHDGISSFEHLLVSPVLVALAWISALFTVVFNLAIFASRWYLDRTLNKGVHELVKRDARVMSLFMKHLSFSDLLTGIYMICICTYNELYRGSYRRHALQWINSTTCQALGVLAMSSAEISMMILTLIAVDRFLTITHGFHKPQISTSSMRIVLLLIWIFGIAIAIIPAFLWNDKWNNYYGNNGVCLPLYLQEPHLKGWVYSMAVVIGLNGLLILLILLAYGGIFICIQKWRVKSVTIDGEERDLLWRFLMLVFINLCCWLPTFVFKLMAAMGFVLPNESYAWIVTFVFPLNSAMNPIVYSLSSSEFRDRLSRVREKDTICAVLLGNLRGLQRRMSAPFTSSHRTSSDGIQSRTKCASVRRRAGMLQSFRERCRSSLVPVMASEYRTEETTVDGRPQELFPLRAGQIV